MFNIKCTIRLMALLSFMIPLVTNACVTRTKTAYDASIVVTDGNQTLSKNLYIVIGTGTAKACGWRKKKKASVAAAGLAAVNLKHNWHNMIVDQGLEVAARELCHNRNITLTGMVASARTGYSSPKIVYSTTSYPYGYYRC